MNTNDTLRPLADRDQETATITDHRAIHRLAAALLVTLVLARTPAAQSADCDRACLTGIADRYMAALVAHDASAVPWAARVRFTENDVPMMIGDGLWGSVTKISDAPFKLADPVTGNVLWYGIVEEHGLPAYYAMRIGVVNRKVADVETTVAREGTPAHYAPTTGYRVDTAFATSVPASPRRPTRDQMIALVDGYYNSVQMNDGKLLVDIAGDCRRVSNGVATSHADGVPAGCRAQLEAGLFKPVDRVRARRYPLVDEDHGIVVAVALLDHAARYVDYTTLDGVDRKIPVEYPNSHGVVELFKIASGAIQRVEGIAVFQPYLMPTLWKD